MKMSEKRLNIQYSIMQAVYWGMVCTLCGGFTSVFLLSRGFSNTQVGITVSVGNVLGVILQLVLAAIVDSSKKVSLHVVTGILGVLVCIGMALLFVTTHTVVATIAVFIVSFSMIQSLQSFCNSISMYYVNQGLKVNFGIARGCGSAFYALVSTMLGRFVEQFGAQIILIAGIVLTIIFFLCVFTMPRAKKEHCIEQESAIKDQQMKKAENEKSHNLFEFLKMYKGFPVLLLGVAFVFVFHSMSNTYMYQMMQRVGGSSENLGIALSIAAIVELPVMAGFSLLGKRFRAHQLLRFSGIMFAVKAISYLFAQSVMCLYLCQLLQMGAYAIFIPASVFYVNELVDECDMVKGQAFIVSASTLGGVFASMLGGIFIDNFGVFSMLIFQLIMASLGALLFFFAPKIKN